MEFSVNGFITHRSRSFAYGSLRLPYCMVKAVNGVRKIEKNS